MSSERAHSLTSHRVLATKEEQAEWGWNVSFLILSFYRERGKERTRL